MPDPFQPVGPPLFSWRRTARSFRFAGAGIVYVLRTQPNARVHVMTASAACALAAWLGLSAVAWAVLLGAITLVLALEALNTAMEFAIDLVSPEFHPLAKAAKDCAAAAVLFAAVGSVAVGGCLFVPPLLGRLAG